MINQSSSSSTSSSKYRGWPLTFFSSQAHHFEKLAQIKHRKSPRHLSMGRQRGGRNVDRSLNMSENSMKSQLGGQDPDAMERSWKTNHLYHQAYTTKELTDRINRDNEKIYIRIQEIHKVSLQTPCLSAFLRKSTDLQVKNPPSAHRRQTSPHLSPLGA